MCTAKITSQDDIEITLYKSWMCDQVVRMICRQYGREENHQDNLIKNFYEHPYQREKSIRIVAMDGEKVVGFQSFFYWHYLLDGKPMNAYQSGNSLVSPNYRGRGIFRGLLSYMDEIREDKHIDFLSGFPVADSYNSFIRNKWCNILNLNWYVKPISLFSILRRFDITTLYMGKAPEDVPGIPVYKGFSLNRDPEFEAWRKYYSDHNHYLYYYYADGSYRVRFDLKVNLRGRLKELIVGRLQTNCYRLGFLKTAVKALVRKVRGQHAFTLLSVALNSRYYKTEIIEAFRRAGFRGINKQIYFIVKDFTVGERLFQPELWELYRSDIDTW